MPAGQDRPLLARKPTPNGTSTPGSSPTGCAQFPEGVTLGGPRQEELTEAGALDCLNVLCAALLAADELLKLVEALVKAVH